MERTMPTGALFSHRVSPKWSLSAHPFLLAIVVALAGVALGAVVGLVVVELIHWLSWGEPLVAIRPQVA
jgi:hypothetical protein